MELDLQCWNLKQKHLSATSETNIYIIFTPRSLYLSWQWKTTTDTEVNIDELQKVPVWESTDKPQLEIQ